jgi:hypothetical protein
VTIARRVLRKLCALAEKAYPRSVITTGSHADWKVTGPALVARCTRLAQAIQTIPTSHESAAQVLLRALYEHVVVFGWLAADPPGNLKVWVAHDRREKLKIFNDVIRVEQRDVLPAAKRAEFEAAVAAGGNWPGLPALAAKLDAHWSTKNADFFQAKGRYSFVGMYPATYRGPSPMVHATVDSLLRVTRPGPGKGECIVHLDDHPAGESNAFSTARIIYALCLVLSSYALGFPSLLDVLEVFDREHDDDSDEQ